MRRVLLGTIAGLGLAFGVQSSCGEARAFESFTLEPHDQLIVEAPGCEAECRVTGKSRTCTVKAPSCRAVCRTLPECRPAGEFPMKVCATFKGRE